MTENEAIECLKCYRAQSGTSFPEEIEMAVNALEEIEQYRAIGTPEECLRNKDFLDFLSDKMNPNDFETYLHLYNGMVQENREPIKFYFEKVGEADA